MGEHGGDESEGRSNAIDRRRLLKGAAAAGVGVAAWSTPEITSLGGTPVYAAVCTAPVNTFEVSARNTSCNCGSNPNKVANYKVFKTPCGANPVFPGSAVLRSGSCLGTVIGESGECPPGFGGNAGVCVSAPPSGQVCKIVVRVEQGNCGAPLIATAASGIFAVATWVPMPSVPCQGSGNVFVRTQIVCSRDPACL